MKLTRCNNCKKFTAKDIWGQQEAWRCNWCLQQVCVWCYVLHTVIHYPHLHPKPSEEKSDANQG